MKPRSTPFTDQHLFLRLLIMLMALAGNLGASFRQLALQILLFLLFFLFDLPAFRRLLRALRVIMMFLAAYWLFATLLGTDFPLMILFSLKLIFFAQISVYTFSHLSIPRVLHDCQWLLHKKWGVSLVFYLAATIMFIQSLHQHFAMDKTGNLSQRFLKASKATQQEGSQIQIRLDSAMSDPASWADALPASSLTGLVLLSLMAILGAI